MLIIRLMGGLGNQMFQYAFYRALISYGMDARVDLSWFQAFQAHNGFELKKVFDIDLQEAQAYRNDCERLGYTKYDIWHRLMRKFYKKKSFYEQSAIEGIRFDKRFFHVDEMYLSGYWQSEKYFSTIDQIIRTEFSFKQELDEVNTSYKDMITRSLSVSLHVRRGDYVKNRVHGGICADTYYQKAVNYINKYVKQAVFFVFSDDIAWCKKNLCMQNAIYVDHNYGSNSYWDMYLMSLCQHHIIANSSFSWWGAWLGNNPDKIVVAPKQWFNINGAAVNDLLPEKWMQV